MLAVQHDDVTTHEKKSHESRSDAPPSRSNNFSRIYIRTLLSVSTVVVVVVVVVVVAMALTYTYCISRITPW